MHRRPAAHLTCPECMEVWGEDAYDFHLTDQDEIFQVIEFIGRTLRDVEEDYSKRVDGVYSLRPFAQFKNPKYIDNSPAPKYEGLKVNPGGWYPVPYTNALMDYDHIIETGDEVRFDVQKWYHKECYTVFLEKLYRQHFTEIFSNAGFIDFSLEVTKNGYSECSGPWFNVQTGLGVFRIGWRKRVINIDWPSNMKCSHLFKNENTTQDGSSIHAWGKSKAIQYLSMILQLSNLEKVAYVHET